MEGMVGTGTTTTPLGATLPAMLTTSEYNSGTRLLPATKNHVKNTIGMQMSAPGEKNQLFHKHFTEASEASKAAWYTLSSIVVLMGPSGRH